MARKQKLLPHVETITSDAIADKVRGAPSAYAPSSASSAVEASKSFRHMSPYLRAPPSGSVPIPPEETLSQVSRSNRYARYEAVRALHQQLVSQREIARNLSLSRNTVRKFLQAETFPERSRPPYRGSILDPYKLAAAPGALSRVEARLHSIIHTCQEPEWPRIPALSCQSQDVMPADQTPGSTRSSALVHGEHASLPLFPPA